jgi:anti-sigma regulatory factor (Ser/Thr protein kinase)
VQHSNATESPVATRPKAFRHDAVFYHGEGGFAAAVLTFVTDAVERAEPVLVAVPRARTAVLRRELGEASSRVEFVDMEAAGKNPACIIPVWHDFAARHAGGGKALNGVGEPVWAGRSRAEIAECQRHESLLNLAFAGARSFALICPYDEAALPADVLAEARQSHPHVVEGGTRRASAAYHGLDAIGSADRRPLAPPLEIEGAHAFSAGDLRAARQEVAAWAISCGVAAYRAADLALAVHEAAVNSVRHGGGGGVLRYWREDDAVVCEIADAGDLRDPLAGRSLPAGGSPSGRGLWLINHLCDLVQIRATAPGTLVRLRLGSSRTP